MSLRDVFQLEKRVVEVCERIVEKRRSDSFENAVESGVAVELVASRDRAVEGYEQILKRRLEIRRTFGNVDREEFVFTAD